ncbi:hypothetical protein GC177_05085 [bacterium]|nr:hypothetical protein [bacterium]
MALYKKILCAVLALFLAVTISVPLILWWGATSATGKHWIEKQMAAALERHTELKAEIKIHSIGLKRIEFEDISTGTVRLIGSVITWEWEPLPVIKAIRIRTAAASLSYNDGILIIPGITDVDEVEDPTPVPIEERIKNLLDAWPQDLAIGDGTLDMVINGQQARLTFDMDVLRDDDGSPILQLAGKLAGNAFGGKVFLETHLMPRMLQLPGFDVTFQITGGEGDIGFLIPAITKDTGFALLKDAAFKISVKGVPEDYKFESELYTKGKMAIPGIGNLPQPMIKTVLKGRVSNNRLSATLNELYWGQRGESTLMIVPEKPILLKGMEWYGVPADAKQKPTFSAEKKGDAWSIAWDGLVEPLHLNGNWVDAKNVMDKTTKTISEGKVEKTENTTPKKKNSIGTAVSLSLSPSIMTARAAYDPTKNEDKRLTWQKGSKLALTARAENLDIQTLLQYWVQETATAEGKLTGTFPIILTPEGIEIEGGKLAASKDGRIRYKSENVTGDESIGILYQALEDFHYKVLETSIDTPEPNKVHAVIRLEGYNPNVYDGTTIQLNVNLNADYSKLWKSGNAAWNIEQSVQEQLDRAKK